VANLAHSLVILSKYLAAAEREKLAAKINDILANEKLTENTKKYFEYLLGSAKLINKQLKEILKDGTLL
jgi:hypothetical protein